MTTTSNVVTEEQDPAPKPEANPLIDGLREEFMKQIGELKETTNKVIAEKDARIAALDEQVKTLQSAAVANFVSAPAPAEPQKTEEQLYDERITELSKNALAFAKTMQ